MKWKCVLCDKNYDEQESRYSIDALDRYVYYGRYKNANPKYVVGLHMSLYKGCVHKIPICPECLQKLFKKCNIEEFFMEDDLYEAQTIEEIGHNRFVKLYNAYMYREISIYEFACELGVSVEIVRKLIKDYTAKKQK